MEVLKNIQVMPTVKYLLRTAPLKSRASPPGRCPLPHIENASLKIALCPGVQIPKTAIQLLNFQSRDPTQDQAARRTWDRWQLRPPPSPQHPHTLKAPQQLNCTLSLKASSGSSWFSVWVFPWWGTVSLVICPDVRGFKPWTHSVINFYTACGRSVQDGWAASLHDPPAANSCSLNAKVEHFSG